MTDAASLGLRFVPTVKSNSWTKQIRIKAASPKDRARKGKDMIILYGAHDTPVGEMFVAVCDDELLWLGFEQKKSLQKCRKLWPAALFEEDRKSTAPVVKNILSLWQGKALKSPLTITAYGTDFQISVWKTLMLIPTAHVVSYSAVAEKIGKPTASRAVGTAVGSNPVSLLIPCHRVVQANGSIVNYGWGTPKKKQLLQEEVRLTA